MDDNKKNNYNEQTKKKQRKQEELIEECNCKSLKDNHNNICYYCYRNYLELKKFQ